MAIYPIPPLEIHHALPAALRAILRSIVEDRQSVPANYYITCSYDYHDDSLVVEIIEKVGLDCVAQATFS